MKDCNFDVVIVGGSFSGMTCALALAQITTDLKIAIIEKQQILNTKRDADGRAYAISSQSLNFFKEIEIFDELEKIAGKISDIKITDYKSPFILDFIGSEVNKQNPQLGLIIENHFIFEALKAKIKDSKNIFFFESNFYESIDFDQSPERLVKITLKNNQQIFTKVILACDGRFSQLRTIYKIPTLQKNYHQTAIVFKIKHQFDHNNIAHERFLPNGPLAILPLKDPHQSSIVWIGKEEDMKIIDQLDEKNFLQQLNKKMENCLGELEITSEKFSYPLTLIEAEKFYYNKMLLVGDSACAIHPIAGQGFNLTIGNIMILQKLIKHNLLSGINIFNDELIINYNKQAKLNAKKMIIATDILNSIFETRNFSISFIRNIGLGIVNHFPKLKNFFIKNAGGY
jgi:2-octaprenyl-6-methoxyphenol hydroxylase